MASFFRVTKPSRFLVVLRVLWLYLWGADEKIRYRLVLSIIGNTVAIILSVSAPLLFARVVDSISSFNTFVTTKTFLVLLITYVVIWSLSKILLCIREIIMFPVIERAIHLLALDLFQHIQLLPFLYHLKRKTGEITTTIEAAVQSFPPIIWPLAFVLFPLVLESLCVFIVIAFICGIYYSLILSTCLAFYVIATHCGFTKTLKWRRESNFSHFAATSKIVDSFLNFSSIKYFHTYNFEFQKINQALDLREHKVTNSLVKDQIVRVYQTIILSLSFLLLMVFTGYNLILNRLSLGEFVMIHTYMLQFIVPLEVFAQVFQMINQNFVKMEKALRTFKKPLEKKHGSIVVDQKEPLHIVFEDIWFGYHKKIPILKGITFEILPNQTVAIIGKTGSGKSTIVSLLLGFLEPWKGRILVNGQDLKNIDRESLINLIGIVPQDVTLFNDTIARNVLYADTSASQKQLMEAINIASLNETAQKFPQGLETIVGERGAQLSGGEKQRVGLARAIIRKPKLYIFDEATSSLDSKTEKQIIKNIETVSRNASTLIITHRLSTIAFADKIILLEKGSAEDKSYKTLM